MDTPEIFDNNQSFQLYVEGGELWQHSAHWAVRAASGGGSSISLSESPHQLPGTVSGVPIAESQK